MHALIFMLAVAAAIYDHFKVDYIKKLRSIRE
jgi:hypothetical protein